jgi:hypothetical protein
LPAPGMVATRCYRAMKFLGCEELLFAGPVILPDSELRRCSLPFSMDDMTPWKGSLLIGASSVYLGKAPQRFAYRASPSGGGERREVEIPVEG